jgi:putative colanic acid biosynthesis UDP-glucose lipid carrier transferase
MVRHFVKPGLTGLAQVKGYKGAHDLEQMQARVKTDVYYLENWSALLDLSIVLRTIGVAFKGERCH